MTGSPQCVTRQRVGLEETSLAGAFVIPEKISIRQLKAARHLLGWSQEDLAERSGVSIPTIRRLEAKGGELGGYKETRDKIRAALAGAGIEFLIGDNEGPGVRLRRPK